VRPNTKQVRAAAGGNSSLRHPAGQVHAAGQAHHDWLGPHTSQHGCAAATAGRQP
jgi:hypothetical protein